MYLKAVYNGRDYVYVPGTDIRRAVVVSFGYLGRVWRKPTAIGPAVDTCLFLVAGTLTYVPKSSVAFYQSDDVFDDNGNIVWTQVI